MPLHCLAWTAGRSSLSLQILLAAVLHIWLQYTNCANIKPIDWKLPWQTIPYELTQSNILPSNNVKHGSDFCGSRENRPHRKHRRKDQQLYGGECRHYLSNDMGLHVASQQRMPARTQRTFLSRDTICDDNDKTSTKCCGTTGTNSQIKHICFSQAVLIII